MASTSRQSYSHENHYLIPNNVLIPDDDPCHYANDESVNAHLVAAANVASSLWNTQIHPPSCETLSPPESSPYIISSISTTAFSEARTLQHLMMSTMPVPVPAANFGAAVTLPPRFDFTDQSCLSSLVMCDDVQSSYVHDLLRKEGCPAFMSDCNPLHDQATAEKWGNGKVQRLPPPEECNVRVGRYSVDERKRRILRYLKKRNERNFNKTIKYACRKTLADRRVRVRGRFARNSEPCEEEIAAAKRNKKDAWREEDQLVLSDALQMKQVEEEEEEEEWVQEAMANLLYLPYSSMGDRCQLGASYIDDYNII